MTGRYLIVQLLLAAGSALAALPLAIAHPGGQDKHGCHVNKATGIYHCHKGPLKGRSFDDEAAMLRALAAAKR